MGEDGAQTYSGSVGPQVLHHTSSLPRLMRHGLCRGWGLRTEKDDQVAIEQPITAVMADIFDQLAGHLVDGEF